MYDAAAQRVDSQMLQSLTINTATTKTQEYAALLSMPVHLILQDHAMHWSGMRTHLVLQQATVRR
jgi:hypothetical protein